MLFADVLAGLEGPVREHIETQLESAVYEICHLIRGNDQIDELTLMKKCSKIEAVINLAQELQERLVSDQTS